MKPGTIDSIRDKHPLMSVLPACAAEGICPFCNGEWFRLCEVRGLYHCPDCDEQGDVVTATMKLNGVNFREAIERLLSSAVTEGKGASRGFYNNIM